MTLRIALISEHASPLATLGGVDAGGQNVYVDQVARGLAAMGHLVDVFTRRDAPGSRNRAARRRGSASFTCPPDPAGVPKEDLLPHMPAFATWMARFMARQPAGTTWSMRTSSCPASLRPISRRGPDSRSS